MTSRQRLRAFVALVCGCLLAAAVIVAVAVGGARGREQAAKETTVRARPAAASVLDGAQPFVVMREIDPNRPAEYGRIVVAPVAGGRRGAPLLAGPACNRVAYRSGAGLCLGTPGVRGFAAAVLDGRLHVRHTRQLLGVPSRARISPDGHWGGVTAFVVGHAYAEPGNFSTIATVIDLRTGRPVGNLEHDFAVTRHGRRVTARDRNYWGLTFAPDGDTFYATLGVDDSTWLIKGSIRHRTAHTIHANVECPSVSPDGRRIAYKKAIAENPTQWRFHVLDLATGRDVALAETRSIDDQLEWLDDDQLLYGTPEGDTWTVPADGSGSPRVWAKAADSPTVARP